MEVFKLWEDEDKKNASEDAKANAEGLFKLIKEDALNEKVLVCIHISESPYCLITG